MLHKIVKKGQNTENSLGDLMTPVFTQTPVKDHQITLLWKPCKE